MDGRTDVPEVGVGGWSPARARVGDGWGERWMEVEGRRQAMKEESGGGLRSTVKARRVASKDDRVTIWTVRSTDLTRSGKA